ncbi:hypothetical protein FHU41_002319 [Psychromicrobium silvestre]|uniref:Uncharacterized protein n=1 Tax=Psychromicrobium silvestre TaxID=1645614 RepID=A0A7Y9LUY9_9MICC|nr:hypothetical protein [Psychromicrobium silvestre]NYE96069.1 hypothetical protein [Psychromicrobium silvestre]
MDYLAVIVPSLGVGVVFFFAMKAIFNADRSERQALARAEEEADRKADSEQ